MGDGTEPLDDDETVYRRILPEWARDPADGRPMLVAFRPTDDDHDGLSFVRAKYASAREAARGRRQRYCVACLRVRDIRAIGLNIVPEPLEPVADEPPAARIGHCRVPELNTACRGSEREYEWRRTLAKDLCFLVLGPFEGDPGSPIPAAGGA
jgi:hypothetical protein